MIAISRVPQWNPINPVPSVDKAPTSSAKQPSEDASVKVLWVQHVELFRAVLLLLSPGTGSGRASPISRTRT